MSLLGILLAAVAAQALGAFWYSPAGFGNQWVKAMDFSKKQLESMGDSKKGYIGSFILSLITAYVLSMVLGYAGASSISAAAGISAMIWAGFHLPLVFGSMFWEDKPFSLVVINSGYYLVSLIVMALILTVV